MQNVFLLLLLRKETHSLANMKVKTRFAPFKLVSDFTVF